MPRPEWLHWQPLRFSAWLWLFLLISAAPPIAYLLIRYGTLLSSLSLDDVPRLTREFYALPRSPFIAIYTLASQLVLIWFTYFSGSPRVREHDKFSVFVMSAATAIAWMLIVVDGMSGITARLLPN